TFITFFYVFLLMNTLTRTEVRDFAYVGQFTIQATLALMFLLLLKTWIQNTTYDVSLIGIYTVLFLMMFMFSISYLSSDYMDNPGDIIQLVALPLFILGSVRMYWSRTLLKIAGYIFGAVTVFFFYDWMQSGFPMFGFKSVYRNENYLAVLLLSFSYF